MTVRKINSPTRNAWSNKPRNTATVTAAATYHARNSTSAAAALDIFTVLDKKAITVLHYNCQNKKRDETEHDEFIVVTVNEALKRFLKLLR